MVEKNNAAGNFEEEHVVHVFAEAHYQQKPL